MLLQDAPPDTSAYMIAGFTVFFVISAIYLLSLILRRRNLERDLETLRSMEAESGRRSRPPSAAALAPTRPRNSRAEAARRKPARKKVTRRK